MSDYRPCTGEYGCKGKDHIYDCAEYQMQEQNDRLLTGTPAPTLDEGKVLSGLSAVIADLDYDLWKNITRDEMTGENTWPDVVAVFIDAYETALSEADLRDGF